MTAKEKYLEEKDELKSARINRILESSFLLFAEKGIDTIAMTDIAKKAEIGVASLYRYFSTKDEIAIRTAIWIWEKQKEILLPVLESTEYKEMKGINQIEKILSLYIFLFKEQSDFLRFIYFFDSYAVRTKVSSERLKDYESMIQSINSYVVSAINKGLNDKTINSKYSNEKDKLYITLMHTMFSATQKLTISGNMLNIDSAASGIDELQSLSNILIQGLK